MATAATRVKAMAGLRMDIEQPPLRLDIRVGGARSGGDDTVAEDPDPLDLHLAEVPGAHLAGMPWRAGVDEVARAESDEAADVADHGGAVEDQIGGDLLLHHLAVEARLQEEPAVLEPAHQHRAAGGEGVRPLGPPPLQVLVSAALPLALADVVAAGDPEDRLPGLGRRRVLDGLADH